MPRETTAKPDAILFQERESEFYRQGLCSGKPGRKADVRGLSFLSSPPPVRTIYESKTPDLNT